MSLMLVVRMCAGIAATSFVLAGCAGSAASNPATLQAEATAFADESTQIALSIESQGTAAVSTAAAARTQIMQIDALNQQLALTLRAAIPPTQQIVNSYGVVTPGMNAPLPGQFTPAPSEGTVQPGTSNQLTQIGPALSVLDDDGCAASLVQTVSSGTPRIYATTRMLNAVAGTQVSVSWSVDGQVVYTNTSFALPQDDPDFCLWFYIEPSDVTFSPGNWSIQFLINGTPAGQPSGFVITG